ncbi:MAG TPA: F0F1 ATP synthase subunit A [Clostridiales bacterium]|nr:F0F1 ATP synthase subunit A [Clostridiales bacterium]
MGERILEAMTPKKIFSIQLPGVEIPVTDVVIVSWIIMAVIIILALLFTSRLKLVPDKRQAAVEITVEGLYNMVKNQTGHHYAMVAPYIGTILIFLVISNVVSIFNILPDWEYLHRLTGWKLLDHIPTLRILPPTRNVNVTAAMGIMSILAVIIYSVRAKGVIGWIKNFKKPIGLMIPFNILDYIFRPVSLCFRLFGNILGGVIIMELIYIVLPVAIPAALSLYFDLFDGLLQAYVFAILTAMYIGEAIES